MIDKALDLVAPHICAVCKAEGKVVCNSCQFDIVEQIPSSCFLCNASNLDFLTCFSCSKKSPLKHVWIASKYSEDTKIIIAKFKFERQRAAATQLAQMLGDSLPFFKDPPIISFVPTATSRVRQRGYDHSQLLAKELGQQKNWPVIKLLSRVGQSRQVGSSRIARNKQTVGAYRAIRNNLTKNKSILLVDDIVTTGSTLNQCSKTLKRAGAKEVNAVVVAKKV